MPRILCYPVLNSTTTLARRLARQGASDRTVVMALEQKGGMGRAGRCWHSPPGGLYCSIILRPGQPIERLRGLTLAAGVAVAGAVGRVTGITPLLKWPNDLLIEGRKLGGILTETAGISAAGEVPAHVILGIGINVNTPAATFPELPGNIPASLVDIVGRTTDLKVLVVEIEAALHEELRRCWSSPDDSALYRRWSRLDALKGKELLWKVDEAGGQVRGQGLGLDETGRYLVRDPQGQVHAAISGDLSQA